MLWTHLTKVKSFLLHFLVTILEPKIKTQFWSSFLTQKTTIFHPLPLSGHTHHNNIGIYFPWGAHSFHFFSYYALHFLPTLQINQTNHFNKLLFSLEQPCTFWLTQITARGTQLSSTSCNNQTSVGRRQTAPQTQKFRWFSLQSRASDLEFNPKFSSTATQALF